MTWVLYKLYDVDGGLLYVGISSKLRERFYNHARTQPWWHQVRHMEARIFQTKGQAQGQELLLILDERPRYNRQYIDAKDEGIGGRIRRLRARAALTQNDLSVQIDIYNHDLAAIERGRKQPTPRVANKIARALGVSVEELAS